jgi:hypothetical protein
MPVMKAMPWNMRVQWPAMKPVMVIGDEAGLTLVPEASMTVVVAPGLASCCMPGMLAISCCAASGAASNRGRYKRISSLSYFLDAAE